jgi:hypothetical protein
MWSLHSWCPAATNAAYRSMAERGDLAVLHEPFCNLKNYGETDAGGRTFDSAPQLLAWLRGEAHDWDVFFKDTQYDPVGDRYRTADGWSVKSA